MRSKNVLLEVPYTAPDDCTCDGCGCDDCYCDEDWNCNDDDWDDDWDWASGLTMDDDTEVWNQIATTTNLFHQIFITDEMLENISYEFRIVAITATMGNSESFPEEFDIADNYAAPESLRAENVWDSQVDLKWDNIEDEDVDGIIRIQWSSNGINWSETILSTGSSSYRPTGLSASTLYQFRVRVEEEESVSCWSTVQIKTAAPAPTNLRFDDVWHTQVDLTWDAVPGAADYWVFVNGANITEGQGLEWISPTKARISGLNPETSYSFTVRTLSNCPVVTGKQHPSLHSTPISVFTGPNQPTDLKISEPRGNQLKLTRTNTAATAEYFVIDYNGQTIRTNQTGGSVYVTDYKVSGNTVSCTVVGLTPDETYNIQVRSYRNDGSRSGWSNTVTQKMGPPSPSMRSVTYDSATKQLRYTWRDNSTTEIGFLVEVSINGGSWTRVGGQYTDSTKYKYNYAANTTSGYLSNITLKKGDTYSFRVRAVSDTAISNASEVYTFKY